MADYKVIVRQSAIDELSDIDNKTLQRLARLIGALSESPTAAENAVKFSSRNFYRMRQGTYRISYFVDEIDRVVDVFKVGQRKNIFGQ